MVIKCKTCQEELLNGSFLKTAQGHYHRECFICAVCNASLADKGGYIFFSGYFLCGPQCRATAAKNPEILPANIKSWLTDRETRSGWRRQDGVEGLVVDPKNPRDPVKVLPDSQ